MCRGLSKDQLEQLGGEELKGVLEEQCSVCCCGMEIGEVVINLLCKHSFHKECLAGWLAKEKHCPLCKQEVAPIPVTTQ